MLSVPGPAVSESAAPGRPRRTATGPPAASEPRVRTVEHCGSLTQ
jgi:hypothetical protein